MTNAERDAKRIMMDAQGEAWLARHVKAANHGGRPDPTCPMCIRIVASSMQMVAR